MQRWLLSVALVLSLVVFATSATADTSDSSDIVNPKLYGNCRVWTEVSMFTDESSHGLECKEETLTDVTSVGVMSGQRRLIATLSKGVMFHLDAQIAVAFRIDKGEIREGKWVWVSGANRAVTMDEEVAIALLNELPTGRRIAVKVGDEGGNVILDGSAAAVKDFRSRIRQPEPAISPPQAKQPRGDTTARMQNIQLQAYQGIVQARITKAWHLPMMKKTAQALQAVVLLTIDREGQVIRYQLITSSGNRRFDDALKRAVRASSPLPPLPEAFPGDILEAEIHFAPLTPPSSP